MDPFPNSAPQADPFSEMMDVTRFGPLLGGDIGRSRRDLNLRSIKRRRMPKGRNYHPSTKNRLGREVGGGPNICPDRRDRISINAGGAARPAMMSPDRPMPLLSGGTRRRPPAGLPSRFALPAGLAQAVKRRAVKRVQAESGTEVVQPKPTATAAVAAEPKALHNLHSAANVLQTVEPDAPAPVKKKSKSPPPPPARAKKKKPAPPPVASKPKPPVASKPKRLATKLSAGASSSKAATAQHASSNPDLTPKPMEITPRLLSTLTESAPLQSTPGTPAAVPDPELRGALNELVSKSAAKIKAHRKASGCEPVDDCEIIEVDGGPGPRPSGPPPPIPSLSPEPIEEQRAKVEQQRVGSDSTLTNSVSTDLAQAALVADEADATAALAVSAPAKSDDDTTPTADAFTSPVGGEASIHLVSSKEEEGAAKAKVEEVRAAAKQALETMMACMGPMCTAEVAGFTTSASAQEAPAGSEASASSLVTAVITGSTSTAGGCGNAEELATVTDALDDEEAWVEAEERTTVEFLEAERVRLEKERFVASGWHDATEEQPSTVTAAETVMVDSDKFDIPEYAGPNVNLREDDIDYTEPQFMQVEPGTPVDAMSHPEMKEEKPTSPVAIATGTSFKTSSSAQIDEATPPAVKARVKAAPARFAAVFTGATSSTPQLKKVRESTGSVSLLAQRFEHATPVAPILVRQKSMPSCKTVMAQKPGKVLAKGRRQAANNSETKCAELLPSGQREAKYISKSKEAAEASTSRLATNENARAVGSGWKLELARARARVARHAKVPMPQSKGSKANPPGLALIDRQSKENIKLSEVSQPQQGDMWKSEWQQARNKFKRRNKDVVSAAKHTEPVTATEPESTTPSWKVAALQARRRNRATTGLVVQA